MRWPLGGDMINWIERNVRKGSFDSEDPLVSYDQVQSEGSGFLSSPGKDSDICGYDCHSPVRLGESRLARKWLQWRAANSESGQSLFASSAFTLTAWHLFGITLEPLVSTTIAHHQWQGVLSLVDMRRLA